MESSWHCSFDNPANVSLNYRSLRSSARLIFTFATYTKATSEYSYEQRVVCHIMEKPKFQQYRNLCH